MAEDKRKAPDNAAAQFFYLVISYWLFFNLFIDSNIPVLISCNIFHFIGPDTFIYSYYFWKVFTRIYQNPLNVRCLHIKASRYCSNVRLPLVYLPFLPVLSNQP
ncbi:hypothetical protein T07_8866 [Trichinella nelsoni]|uniref:Uncharacterized protein n=1 Tax=Trichinella nelsoni TaxID=6336 RepID=A0A0V0RZM9_9BILA|nr:hypothetical protein T07_8866 [Trichinella nelsoni]